MERAVIVFAVAALIAPAVASAHATLIRTSPAAAHFMVDRYVGFDVPVDISPPASR